MNEFVPFVAGGVLACSVPEDGCPILHRQGQGQTGQTSTQKDLHLFCHHTDQPVSKMHFPVSLSCAAHPEAMMSEFLQLNNRVVSMSFLTLSKMICSLGFHDLGITDKDMF